MQSNTKREPLWTGSFISLTVSSFLLFLNLHMLLSSFSSYVKNELSATDLQVSLVTSVFAASAIATRFMAAVLLKRMSSNRLLFIGLIISAAATALSSLPGSVEGLLIIRVGYGIGFGIASTILPTLVSQMIPLRRMGEGIGYFGLSTSMAMSVGPMIGLNVMGEFGFGTLTPAGSAVVLMMLPLLLLTRALPPSSRSSARDKARADAAMEQKQEGDGEARGFNRKLLFPALLNVILAITYSGLLSFIALYGEIVHLPQVGLFFLFNAITIIVIRPISGRIFDSRGHAAVLIPAAAMVVASMLVLSFATTLGMLIVSALLYGLGFGAIQPTIQAWMIRRSSPEQYGAANSMFYNSTDFGVAIGAVLLGAIASATDYAVMYRYSAGFMGLFIIIYLLGMLVSAARQARSQKEY
ncbi:MFS transporter [Paenibacillus cisolokensis]|uniref:MFS transporter n=1 Tax=Paenibacillus cisolokensis TaxID=1658519 RepID=UPI003D26DB4A